MKTKRILYQVTAFMLCALVSSGFFAFAQKEPPAAPAKVSGTEATADPAKGSVQQKVLAFNLEGFSEKGDKKWEIQGESAESMQEDRIKLKHIVAKSFGDEAEAVLKADKGIYDKTKNNVILEDNVKVTVNNTAGMTNDYVSIPLVDGQGGAQKAKAAPEQPRDKETTTITCDGEVEFNYNSNIVHFAKNVKVASSDGMIDADKITVFLDIKSKKIREVVAEGSVKITRGENVTYSDRATYIEAEKKVVLSGRPKLVFYQDAGGINQQLFGAAEETQSSNLKGQNE